MKKCDSVYPPPLIFVKIELIPKFLFRLDSAYAEFGRLAF